MSTSLSPMYSLHGLSCATCVWTSPMFGYSLPQAPSVGFFSRLTMERPTRSRPPQRRRWVYNRTACNSGVMLCCCIASQPTFLCAIKESIVKMSHVRGFNIHWSNTLRGEKAVAMPSRGCHVKQKQTKTKQKVVKRQKQMAP